MKKQKKQAILRTNLFLLSCSIIVSLLLGEYIVAPVLLKLLNRPSRELQLLGLCGLPNTQVDDTPINSQGFTGHVLQPSKPTQNTIRILTLGGSAMFDHRMTERLIENLAKATSAKLEIQGGALRSHSTRSSLIKYKEHFYRYSFDYVLIYHAINDLLMNHVALENFKADYSHFSPWYKRNTVLKHSLIARYIYNRIFWKSPKRVENGSQFSSYQTFEQNIRELIRLIKRDDSTPLLMTFAWHIPDNYTETKFNQGKLGYNNPTNYDKCPVELWGSVDYVKEGLMRHNAIIKKIAREEQVMLIDIEGMDTFRNNPQNFGDVCHLSEDGTEIFIKIITDFFQLYNLLPTRESKEKDTNKIDAPDNYSAFAP